MVVLQNICSPTNCQYDLIWKVFLQIDLEVSFPWVTWAGPKFNDKCCYKRKKRRRCEQK